MDKCEWPGKKGRPHRGRPFYIYSISKPLAAGKTWTALPAGPVFRPHVKKEVEEKREKVMNKGWRMSLLFILEDTPPFLLEWFQYTGRM